jgi:rRNA maturation RNase YbeY
LLAVVGPARLEVDVIKAVPVPIAPAFLRGVLRQAASMPEVEARLPDGTVTAVIRLTGDGELRRLNREFAGHDAVTDVLSFAGADTLGDLAISWPAASRQAHEYGHSEKTEVALLSVHGLLHLLGWDHATAAQHREMSRLTIAALARSGITPAPGRL